MKRTNKGILFVLSGPSGIGKGTVVRCLAERTKNLVLSTSVTTRSPRVGEKDGVDYFFRTREEFDEMVKNSEFLEYAEYCGNFYGTPKSNLFSLINDGKDVLLEIEVKGGSQVKSRFPGSVTIFVLPPSMDILRRRLMDRGSESQEAVENRLRKAEKEISFAPSYDYIVTNDCLSKCVDDVVEIIHVEHMKSKNYSIF